eukprot:1159438-Pelagomonas_calceolata.AAC.5
MAVHIPRVALTCEQPHVSCTKHIPWVSAPPTASHWLCAKLIGVEPLSVPGPQAQQPSMQSASKGSRVKYMGNATSSSNQCSAANTSSSGSQCCLKRQPTSFKCQPLLSQAAANAPSSGNQRLLSTSHYYL